jgi:tRNA C32,U32 (ribose-2'-O)-methylase TrmJ
MSIPLGKFDSEDDAARAYDVQADVYGKPRNFLQGALGDGPSVKQLPNRYEHGMFARMATEWVTLREFETTRECIAALRDDGRAIWVTDLSQKAICLTREGLGAPEGAGRDDVVPGRLAVVFGTESVGCTEEMLAAADRRVYLPLRGFADSLNLSVAAALVVQALFHLCPAAVGAMPESERSALRAAWFPKLAAQRGGSSEQTKALTRLRARLRDVDYIRAKRDRDGPSALTEVQAAKLLAEPEVRAMEAALAAELAAHAAASVGPWLHHPPSTLADVRRADEHRTAFVGPGVRKSNAAHWAGMAATANDGGKPHPGAIKSPLLVD